ncbi:hypothetical protein [Protofrankia coriariae]|uniref:Uncharacterized protein n=1 Tax=Protofrankia coriariae TaxID=1562887 RepID=A0ABR5F241_9ACTN|nr:hypothetical protein [Protofrankia coriariae]KLL10745.1 hypothetical protein FrCorBMG51_15745 [Protofrankia coriariae]ONH31562.1 hypothetical protein BL254_22900 [Protofrankia sp. BMG5.30]
MTEMISALIGRGIAAAMSAFGRLPGRRSFRPVLWIIRSRTGMSRMSRMSPALSLCVQEARGSPGIAGVPSRSSRLRDL